ncbi:MAG TPA: DegT/DnrJ/EryC1/StrS family aminotransferase [Cellvibrionaceae bacterium]|nr:DegT/DnrJ/EryC1/StrS family aminotransferase [Cellvibrionaceae bacterium]
METLRAIIRGDLPPVGHPILTRPRSAQRLEIAGYHAQWVDSGTSALALALLAARTQRPLPTPEVIVPAYGCPDIVAACIYAGCTARLVDIRPSTWGYDMTQLRQALNTNTLAVVGVNFLGIREHWPALLEVLNSWQAPITTIEDNAQWFPDLSSIDKFYADHLVFSFGKGKPVSLLGGGALFSRHEFNSRDFIKPAPAAGQFFLNAQYTAFNRLLNPSVYWFLNHNPIFKPGATRYAPLSGIYAMDEPRMGLLASNYQAYCTRHDAVSARLHATLCELGVDNNLYNMLNTQNRKLLRFPLLCTTTLQRDTLLTALNKQGLGATAMYQKALADLDCPRALIDVRQSQDQARDFAGRLITLPCHSGVTPQHLAQITGILTKHLRENN